MSAPTASFLGLPVEIRQAIYEALFQSLTVHTMRFVKEPPSDPLALLRTCHQVHAEAAPLVLPNICIRCYGNADMLGVLCRLRDRPEGLGISRLRHLAVDHRPVGFDLGPVMRPAWTDVLEGDLSNTRYFHVGALLGLFPGLRLELLEVRDLVSRSFMPGAHAADCAESLLRADGFRRLTMQAEGGATLFGVPKRAANPYGMTGYGKPRLAEWQRALEATYKPPPGWEVRISTVDEGLVDVSWAIYRDMGFTVVPDMPERAEACHRRQMRGDYSAYADNFAAYRGRAADFAVKPDDVERVLAPVDMWQMGETPEALRLVSDRLRALFRDHSWDEIKAMDGFDDCEDDDDAPYKYWFQ
jgi:hypothetical protein